MILSHILKALSKRNKIVHDKVSIIECIFEKSYPGCFQYFISCNLIVILITCNPFLRHQDCASVVFSFMFTILCSTCPRLRLLKSWPFAHFCKPLCLRRSGVETCPALLNGPLFNLQAHRSGVNCTWGRFPQTKALCLLAPGHHFPVSCRGGGAHIGQQDGVVTGVKNWVL